MVSDFHETFRTSYGCHIIKIFNLIFFPTCMVAMATRHKDFSLQSSKMTIWIFQKSLFFLILYCIYFFCFKYKVWKRPPWPNIFALSLLDTFSSRITMATSCREVYQTFRLNENFHIVSKFQNLCKKLQAYLEFAISLKRASHVGTYKKNYRWALHKQNFWDWL